MAGVLQGGVVVAGLWWRVPRVSRRRPSPDVTIKRAASASGASRCHLSEHGEIHIAFLVGNGVHETIPHRRADRERHRGCVGRGKRKFVRELLMQVSGVP